MKEEMTFPVKLDESFITDFQKILIDLANKTIKEVQLGLYVKPYMNKKEAAEYIGISYNTLKKFEGEGLPVVVVDKIQLIQKNDIDKFLQIRKNNVIIKKEDK